MTSSERTVFDCNVLLQTLLSAGGPAGTRRGAPRFDFPRDPDDANYIDLAVAVSAKLIVSRDHDLLSLRYTAAPEGKQFDSQYPWLEVLTRPEALARLVQSPGG